MMSEEEIKREIDKLQVQRAELLAKVNALEGAIAAFNAVLNPQRKTVDQNQDEQ